MTRIDGRTVDSWMSYLDGNLFKMARWLALQGYANGEMFDRREAQALAIGIGVMRETARKLLDAGARLGVLRVEGTGRERGFALNLNWQPRLEDQDEKTARWSGERAGRH